MHNVPQTRIQDVRQKDCGFVAFTVHSGLLDVVTYCFHCAFIMTSKNIDFLSLERRFIFALLLTQPVAYLYFSSLFSNLVL